MQSEKKRINEQLKKSIESSVKEYDSIDQDRKTLLDNVAEYITHLLKGNRPANLTFICTHNSRRSHISQLWAQAASVYYGVPDIHCFSAGTEATAFNPRAVKAMQTAGFGIKKTNNSENPVYEVSINEDASSIKAFSKLISNSFNPQKDFIAIMTCGNADEACPVVHGANARFVLKYIDPKISDDTSEEEKTYDERSRQIGTEMLYLFSLIQPFKSTQYYD